MVLCARGVSRKFVEETARNDTREERDGRKRSANRKERTVYFRVEILRRKTLPTWKQDTCAAFTNFQKMFELREPGQCNTVEARKQEIQNTEIHKSYGERESIIQH